MSEGEEKLRISGISGSLRKASVNRSILRAARDLAPSHMVIDICDLGAIPLYNGDIDNDEDRPEAVVHLKQVISDSDGLLFVTPEHNYSVPGVLKNAIDWASRPGYRSVLAGKPVGILGATGSPAGTSRAQGHLRQIMFSTMSHVMPHPEVLISQVRSKLDSNGELVDETTRKVISGYLEKFLAWVSQFQEIKAMTR